MGEIDSFDVCASVAQQHFEVAAFGDDDVDDVVDDAIEPRNVDHSQPITRHLQRSL